ncbi:putative RTA1 like protein-domain-containing protein [Seiridium unicorne]|uniref:RTA1 like protein-domain-containing protein n=1 Tax=Seiridium unicorne TaxID=138068 RepID=A0ABR2UHC4_9PEZI
MRKEKKFLVSDGLSVALAAIALAVFHLGFFYPSMRTAPPKSTAGTRVAS